MKRTLHWLATAVVPLALLAACGGGQAPAPSPKAAQPMVAAADTVPTFTGNRNSYKIASAGSGWTVTKTGGATTPVAAGTASIAFADYTVNLGVGANAATLSEADLQLLV